MIKTFNKIDKYSMLLIMLIEPVSIMIINADYNNPPAYTHACAWVNEHHSTLEYIMMGFATHSDDIRDSTFR